MCQSLITQSILISCLTDKDSHDNTIPSGFDDNEELQNGKALQIHSFSRFSHHTDVLPAQELD